MILPDLGAILATLGAFLVAALAVVTNFYRKEKKKSERLKQEVEAVEARVRRQRDMERTERESDETAARREAKARESIRAGHRDGFESER